MSESSVPIDVISGEEFENMGTFDLNDMLRTSVPSYNVTRLSIADAASLVRPATLRGLPPDNSLVLVNGKRRHRSGVIAELGGSLAAGAQGADIMAIPSMAIKQTEILRDGASAQYGSDAVAGVLNFHLKDAASGFSVEARTGEFYEGDGTMYQVMANAGLPLGPDGFANVTFSYGEADRTTRSVQRTDAATLIAAGNNDIIQPYAQEFGAPEYRDNYNLFINTGIQLTDSQEVYLFGNVGGRETEDGFVYRNPNDRDAVYTSGGIRAVIDTNIQRGDMGVVSNCPALPSPGSGSNGVPLDPAVVAADNAAIAALPANCWVLNQLLPGGYNPNFGAKLDDASIVGGIRGEFDGGLFGGMSYDFSASYGRNAAKFFLGDTWNPSMGPDNIINGELQREFDIGSYIQSETNFNMDFVLPIANDMFASDIFFAFGGEYRDEVFEVTLGEENSWAEGRFAYQSGIGTNTYSDGVTVLPDLSVGAHGFAGFNPPQAGVWGRSNIAVYGEVEADVVENFTLGLAVRFEDFEDFGDTTNGKIAARWAITDAFALRGSYSTGFRAPTPGQSNITKVSSITVDGQLQQRGQIPPTNEIAQFLGGEPLQPEDATNFSAGLVWDVSDTLSLTADFFKIDLEDRIASTGTINIAGEPVPPGVNCPNAAALPPPQNNLARCLQELGVPGAQSLSSVSFYTNDFETSTTGVDLVVTYNTDFGNAGNGSLTAAWNWTETEVKDAGEEVSRNRVVDLEHYNPRNRGIFTYNHFLGDFRFLVRASYYDDWISSGFSSDPTPRGADGTGYTLDCEAKPNTGPSGGVLFNDVCYSGSWLFDVEAEWRFMDNWAAIIGAQNVFDEYPPVDKYNLDNTIGGGNIYATSSPFGYEGGFWYLRLRADFE
ncbi:MAG TPA: TonB-dependent receptor [Woeseiaceae bacterium]|nr:TonB-dependent receptor [Woeseiaceae bacterium]